jgi:hypothetical protein
LVNKTKLFVWDRLEFDMHLRAGEPTLGDDTVKDTNARLPVVLAVDYRGEGLDGSSAMTP